MRFVVSKIYNESQLYRHVSLHTDRYSEFHHRFIASQWSAKLAWTSATSSENGLCNRLNSAASDSYSACTSQGIVVMSHGQSIATNSVRRSSNARILAARLAPTSSTFFGQISSETSSHSPLRCRGYRLSSQPAKLGSKSTGTTETRTINRHNTQACTKKHKHKEQNKKRAMSATRRGSIHESEFTAEGGAPAPFAPIVVANFSVAAHLFETLCSVETYVATFSSCSERIGTEREQRTRKGITTRQTRRGHGTSYALRSAPASPNAPRQRFSSAEHAMTAMADDFRHKTK